jgi:hypothetical protein
MFLTFTVGFYDYFCLGKSVFSKMSKSLSVIWYICRTAFSCTLFMNLMSAAAHGDHAGDEILIEIAYTVY